WLWDVIDGFIYPFQVFCSWRSKVKSKTDDEFMMLADGIGRNKENKILGLRRKCCNPFPPIRLFYRTPGYLSVHGLQSVCMYLGDFTLRLKVMDVGEFLFVTHISTHYYVDFYYIMLRRYPEDIPAFVTVLDFFRRM
ncbi:uncharacterized protein C8R40DRAFT_1181445, partial [Lentinula edodes]|uniref:uncharacterized protein n=1 Tax=Lentinula edodes TaxID=5353 RepID=UPI001E8DE913